MIQALIEGAESCATNSPTRNGLPSSRCCPPVGRIDATKDIAAPDPARAGNSRKRGRIPPQIMDYSVSMTIPERLPVREAELRALEILLKSDLKKLLAGKPSNP